MTYDTIVPDPATARDDDRFMRLALQLARRGEGFTRPNPPVGAVVVRHGEVIGRGYHLAAGQPHAEVEALAGCGARADGATLYVTLEPCSTAGRTPACTDLILRHRLARVCVGCRDPNPAHNGRGLEILRQAHIVVAEKLRVQECRELIEPFATRITTGRPFVTLKLALTMDGRMGDRHGNSHWITGTPARNWVQRLRRRADAILVGAGTVAADDPELRCRMPHAGAAWRVVVDGAGRLSADRRLFTDSYAERTIVVTTPVGEARLRQRLPSVPSITLWSFPPDQSGQVPLPQMLQRLAAEKDVMHVVCEGGGRLAGGLVRQGLVDTYAIFFAPMILGDGAGVASVDGTGWLLGEAWRGRIITSRRIGDDLLVIARGRNA